MRDIPEAELVEIGREAAMHVPGLGTVERVKAKFRYDSTGDPAYFFTFLIEEGRDRQAGGLPTSRLSQGIRDLLLARDDWNYPYVRVLNRADWQKVEGA